MPTTPDPVDDSYPEQWKPQHIKDRDKKIDPTEAELWLGSLSPAELQAALIRARGCAK